MLTKEELERAKQDEERHMKRYFPEAWRFFKREKGHISGYLLANLKQPTMRSGCDFELIFERMHINQSTPIYPACVQLYNKNDPNRISFWPITAINVQRYKETLRGWPIVITCGGSPTDKPETKHTIIAMRSKDREI